MTFEINIPAGFFSSHAQLNVPFRGRKHLGTLSQLKAELPSLIVPFDIHLHVLAFVIVEGFAVVLIERGCSIGAWVNPES